MDSFTMEIAGLVVCVKPLFQSTREYCKAFLTDKVPELFIEVCPADLLAEQVLLDLEAVREGLKLRKFKDPFLERTAIQRCVADELLNRNTIMLHGSTVSVDGRAYLFTAPCGTGKSTHTRLWRELFGERAVMVNDDKPFLKITSAGVIAYGSPWCGKHGLASNVALPLAGICLLNRGSENIICRLGSDCLNPVLLDQVHFPQDVSSHAKVLSLVHTLESIVPLWMMQCNMDPEAARISYSSMSAL